MRLEQWVQGPVVGQVLEYRNLWFGHSMLLRLGGSASGFSGDDVL